ncbi:bifunctional proline dehydrogenase/L-glutamate gamma-semialdehyde dehydrogenase PutA [Leptothrix ochracea]|uniref:bifunctional proline dehydrogenase/L-glutamate gamma-semialdehyde dehydrogenase PutA n=1 Tax=Leptothrix ochracea TaxID=735331 RepID=UPI0034E1A804
MRNESGESNESYQARTLHGRHGLSSADWGHVAQRARPWIEAVRTHPAPFWALESLLQSYPISSPEGLALMRLAEALLRIPDDATAARLMRDQLGRTPFPLWLGGWSAERLQHVGLPGVLNMARHALRLLGEQFVFAQDLPAALARAHRNRQGQPQLRYSFDMLGEGARTAADTQAHQTAYHQAIELLAARGVPSSPEEGDGLSIKLSALEPRYEALQHARVMQQLVPRVTQLVDAAARANLNLTLDAEESERLPLSLAVFDALARHVAQQHPHWRGLGLAVQAYQRRAIDTVDEVIAIARRQRLRLMVRLVKGAYWDAEIKRAQVLGLDDYPVWTHKDHTDLAYLACARRLLAEPSLIYPQFASHNATSIAAVMHMGQHIPFELQRLHGMGTGLYQAIRQSTDATAPPHPPPRPPVRIYAPVGAQRDLLAYLVRRLLENGANASFVHQLADPQQSVETLLAPPQVQPSAPAHLPLPRDLYGPARRNARGLDLCSPTDLAAVQHALRTLPSSPEVPPHGPQDATRAMASLARAQPRWNATPLVERCAVLQRTADALEARLAEFCARLVHEGRKTLGDALAEVRETIDLCRYNAQQAMAQLAPQTLPGPTGEHNELRLHGRGVFVCISPWNFPLAIFAGQGVAALVAGNTVAAKPAAQTPAVADAFAELLFDAGLPRTALRVLHGPGPTVGMALVAHPLCAGVSFTGSTAVAKRIQRQLAASEGPIVPLIAETGGLNAMIVDASALPEQVVDAVLQSAFGSAGQRCSCLRLLCLHTSIAEAVLTMLAGAMQTLVLGDPADEATDIGPIVDRAAHAQLCQHLERLERDAKLVARTPMPPNLTAIHGATHIAPVVFELGSVAELREEIFGPVLHVVRWSGSDAGDDDGVDQLVEQINALGYGLTLGVQTRLDQRAEHIATQARVGNVYVNRNMIGAVVGVQPFGGQGLSGTGPKAGGPHYLPRFCVEQTVTLNTAAAGGNATLLSAAHQYTAGP